MEETKTNLFSFRFLVNVFKTWHSYIPVSRKEYTIHILLIIDSLFILIQNSYDFIIPKEASLALILFDLLVVTIWGLFAIKRFRASKDKFYFLESNWYFIPGLVPFPIFRLFLLLGTVKLAIIIYKFIKRGEKDASKFHDRELNFRFRNLFADAISDAIFLQSLDRVEEVVTHMDFRKATTGIVSKHRDEIEKVIHDSLEKKSIISQLNDLPFFNGLTKQISSEITDVMMETIDSEAMAKVTKELYLHMLHAMDDRLRKLDLDRLTNSENK